jgi:hypothetical protein
MVTGKVSMISNGLMNASRMESTMATITAVKKSTMDIPGKMNCRMNMFTEHTTILISHLVIASNYN